MFELLCFIGAGASNDNNDSNTNNNNYGKSKPWRSAYTDELPLNDVNASASIDGKEFFIIMFVMCCIATLFVSCYKSFLGRGMTLNDLVQCELLT